MKVIKAPLVILLVLLTRSKASGFAPKGSLSSRQRQQRTSSVVAASLQVSYTKGENGDARSTLISESIPDFLAIDKAMVLPAVILTTALPVEAAGVLPSALWAYGHYLSILTITGCLIAERILVKPDMSVEDEDTIVKIDVVYGIMAALLIISGFARAAKVRMPMG
jgi:hypothetical protein